MRIVLAWSVCRDSHDLACLYLPCPSVPVVTLECRSRVIMAQTRSQSVSSSGSGSSYGSYYSYSGSCEMQPPADAPPGQLELGQTRRFVKGAKEDLMQVTGETIHKT
eukprot:797342-Amphidinium_carterae.1